MISPTIYRVSSADRDSEAENVAPPTTRILFSSPTVSPVEADHNYARTTSSCTRSQKKIDRAIHANELFPTSEPMDILSQQSVETFITEANDTDESVDKVSPLATPSSTPRRPGALLLSSVMRDQPLNAYEHPNTSAAATAAGSSYSLRPSPSPSMRISRKRTSSDLKNAASKLPTCRKANSTNAQFQGSMEEEHSLTVRAADSILAAPESVPVPAATCCSNLKADGAFQLRPHHLQSTYSFDSHDSNHSISSTGMNTTQMQNSWLHGKSSFTGSPINEQNFNCSLDLSMEEENEGKDEEKDNVAKIRRLNLDYEMKLSLPISSSERTSVLAQETSSALTSKPVNLNKKKLQMNLFPSPDEEYVPSNHFYNMKRGEKRDENNFISPNDVMVDRSLPNNNRLLQKVLSPPTFDFESDVISPPVTIKKIAGVEAAPNDNFVSPNFRQQINSFYGNRSNQGRTAHHTLPKTPMLERKSTRRHRHSNIVDDSKTSGHEISRFNQDFVIMDTIGDGSFGTVYKSKSRLDGCTYAIKINKKRAKGIADRERMLQEVKALAVLSDVSDVAAFHIVRYHQAWIEDDRLHIVTDLCTSTLQDEINNGLLRNDTQRQYKLLREMLLALKLIHQHGKVHLDIKPENIFVKDRLFKLGDFGLVIDETTVGEVEEGDCRYMCRDLLSGNHRDLTKCDIFSLGITMYEIVTGRQLPTDGQEWQDLRAGRPGPMPSSTPLELENIIWQMMNEHGNERPTASKLLMRRQLLSEDEKMLITEKNKARQAKEACAKLLKKITPPKRLLQRSNTCPLGL